MNKKNQIPTNHEVERFLESSLKLQRQQNRIADPDKKLVRDKDYDSNCPKPEDFIEYYPDGTKLNKIKSYIRAVAKYVDEEQEKKDPVYHREYNKIQDQKNKDKK